MKTEKIKLNRGKEVLTANLFMAQPSIAIVIICSGTGIKQVFYADLARWLCQKNITVITFDYSGIGQSLNDNIRLVKSNLIDWAGEIDAVIGFAKQQYPDQPVTLMGHSLGGQLIGFAQNSLQCDKIILIAAQSGYWGFWKGVSKIKMFLIWHIIIPVLTGSRGYLKAKSVSKMENLPGKAARQWAGWCRNKEYFEMDMHPDHNYFTRLQSKMFAISINDDEYAPVSAVEWLTKKFVNADKTMMHLYPGDYGLRSIGHFGIFKKGNDMIWHRLLSFILK